MNKKRVSTTGEEFFYRAERQRLERECIWTLDMRSLVAGPCKRYTYEGRIMWLDRVSRAMFLLGLKKSAGVFTVGTYEAILTKARAAQGAPAGEIPPDDPASRQTGVRVAQVDPMAAGQPAGARQTRRAQSVCFEMDYFRRRSGERLRYELNALIFFGSACISCKTRDISVRGLRVRTQMPFEASAGDSVLVQVFPKEWQGEPPKLRYRVVQVARLLSETSVALACEEDGPNETLDYISDLVSSGAISSAADKKLDYEDQWLTAYAGLAERFYMRSTSVIPILVFCEEGGSPGLKILLRNRNNRRGLDVFRDGEGIYDFTSLTALLENPSGILVTGGGSNSNRRPTELIQVGSNTAQLDDPSLSAFKVVSGQSCGDLVLQTASDLHPLAVHHPVDLPGKQEELCFIGGLVDVTAQLRARIAPFPRSSGQGHPTENESRHSAGKGVQPEVWDLSFVDKRRSEPRFLGHMKVEIDVAGRIYKGMTKDVAVRGLAVEVADRGVEIAVGSRVDVSFPVLEARKNAIKNVLSTYRTIPFEVVGLKPGRRTTLRMRLVPGRRSARFAKAFGQQIEERLDKLTPELAYASRSAALRTSSSAFIESSVTIPVLVFRRTNDDRCILKVGMVQNPNRLAGFFEIGDADFDFSVFGENGRLEELVAQAEQNGSAVLELLLSKQKLVGAPRFSISGIAFEEAIDSGWLTRLAQQDRPYDFCCTQLSLNTVVMPPEPELDEVLVPLFGISEVKAEQLKAEFSTLVAVGDIVDTTAELGLLMER